MKPKIEPFPGKVEMKTVRHQYVTKTGRTGVQNPRTYVLNEEQQAWFCKWFPEVENQIVADAMNISMSSMHRLARQLHLTKSEKGMRGIKKRQAKQIKRQCEKNGWYDSIRGKRPGEACQEGTRLMWQEIREGKREHPFKVLKRKNPRKYRAMLKNKSKSRSELIRKEKFRQEFGLQRETKLHMICVRPYTRRQVNHRYTALQRGYWVMEDCTEQSGERWNIYYDQNTMRTPKFEANLIKDGFHVIAG